MDTQEKYLDKCLQDSEKIFIVDGIQHLIGLKIVIEYTISNKKYILTN